MENTSHNRWHLAAAALMGFTTLVHIFAGGPEIYAPVRASDSLSREFISLFSVIWHAISSLLAIMALALFWIARHRNTAIAAMIALVNLAFVGLFLGYGIADLGNVTTMPQWTLFLPIAILILIGQRRGG